MVAYAVIEPPGVPESQVDGGLRQQGTKIEGYHGKLRVRGINTKLGVP